jgi:hypothetical protein
MQRSSDGDRERSPRFADLMLGVPVRRQPKADNRH